MTRMPIYASSWRSDRIRFFACDEVYDGTSHRHGVVGEPLVVATDQGHVDRALDAFLPAAAQDGAEHFAVQVVHHVVVALDLAGRHQVARRDDTAGLGNDALGYLPHLEYDRADRRRH